VSIQVIALAYYLIVGFGGWQLVRGHGQGWRYLIWMTLLFGPFGFLLGLMARRGARIGEGLAEAAREDTASPET
jgi:hypothetical protein